MSKTFELIATVEARSNVNGERESRWSNERIINAEEGYAIDDIPYDVDKYPGGFRLEELPGYKGSEKKSDVQWDNFVDIPQPTGHSRKFPRTMKFKVYIHSPRGHNEGGILTMKASGNIFKIN